MTITFTSIQSLDVGTTQAARRYHLLTSWVDVAGVTHKAHIAGSNDLTLALSLARGQCKARIMGGARYADCRLLDSTASNAVVDVVRVWR